MNWPASQPAIAPMMTNQSKPMDSLSLSFCGGLRFRRSLLGVVRHLFGEQNDFLDDGRDASEELPLHRGQPVDERLETTDVTEIVRWCRSGRTGRRRSSFSAWSSRTSTPPTGTTSVGGRPRTRGAR